MKVLILHQHYKVPQEGGAIRSYYLARALADRGIETVVITAWNGKSYMKKAEEGIEVHYLPVSYDNKYGFGARSFAFLKFAWKSVWRASRIDGVTVCYAISVPLTVGLAALWLKKRRKIPYCFEVGDLWPDAPIQMGFIQNYFFKSLLYSLERKIYREAESIVALSTSIQSAIAEKVPGKKIYLVPNIADCDFFKPEEKDQNLIARYKTEGKFVVSYIGAVGAANGLDYFLECAHVSRKEKLPVHFLVCGEGALLERLKRDATKLELQNLTFLDFRNRDGVKDILNVTDAAFVCYKNVPILETGSPNKYFDGLASGKLIIINFGGWIKNEIVNNRCGVYLDPHHPEEFVRKIKPLLDDRNLLSQYQAAARTLATSTYSRELLSKRFATIFTSRSA